MSVEVTPLREAEGRPAPDPADEAYPLQRRAIAIDLVRCPRPVPFDDRKRMRSVNPGAPTRPLIPLKPIPFYNKRYCQTHEPVKE